MSGPNVTCEFCAEPAPAGVRFCPSCGEPFGARPAGPAPPRPPRSGLCSCLLLGSAGAAVFAAVAGVSGAVAWGARRRDEAAVLARERDLLAQAEAAATASEAEALAAQVPPERRGPFDGRVAALSHEEALRANDPVLLRAWLARYPDASEGWSIRMALTELETQAAAAAELAADEQAFEAALAAGDPAPYLARHPLPTHATEEERLYAGVAPTTWSGETSRRPSSPWVHAALEYLRGAPQRPLRSRAVDQVALGLRQDVDPDRRAVGVLLADARRSGGLVLRLDGCAPAYDERLTGHLRSQLEALDLALEVIPRDDHRDAQLFLELSCHSDPTVLYGPTPRDVVTARFAWQGWETTYRVETPLTFSVPLGDLNPVTRATADELVRLDLLPW